MRKKKVHRLTPSQMKSMYKGKRDRVIKPNSDNKNKSIQKFNEQWKLAEKEYNQVPDTFITTISFTKASNSIQFTKNVPTIEDIQYLKSIKIQYNPRKHKRYTDMSKQERYLQQKEYREVRKSIKQYRYYRATLLDRILHRPRRDEHTIMMNIRRDRLINNIKTVYNTTIAPFLNHIQQHIDTTEFNNQPKL